MGKSVRNRNRPGYGYAKSQESGRWIEVCLNPSCPCYGITRHWGVDRSEHRPFTAQELIEMAELSAEAERLGWGPGQFGGWA